MQAIFDVEDCIMFGSFAEALHATGPAPDRARNLELYGWLIGDWAMDAEVTRADGSKYTGPGEIHFGWVLEGRAIQDVWVLPGLFHGTTLRVYDAKLDAWHILWSDPLHQVYRRQLGRRSGADIVQNGEDEARVPVRWSFVDITPDSFRWLGERSPDRERWDLQAEFRARRIKR